MTGSLFYVVMLLLSVVLLCYVGLWNDDEFARGNLLFLAEIEDIEIDIVGIER